MAEKLTNKTCRNAKALAGERLEISDTVQRGLALRITGPSARNPEGTKTWTVWRRIGKSGPGVRSNIGTYPDMTLAAARDEAAIQFRALKEGRNPKAEAEAKIAAEAHRKREAELAAMRAKEGTVSAQWKVYYATRCEGKKRTAHKMKLMFEGEIEPKIGKHTLANLRRADVMPLLHRIVARGSETQAQRVMEMLRGFFNWYGAFVDEDFTSPLPRRALTEKVIRERALDDEELRALWAVTADFSPRCYGALLRALLLTGARLNELLGARDGEIKDHELIVPKERVKAKEHKARPHLIPLTPEAKAIIATVPRIVGNPHLFAVRREGKFVNLSKAKARLDAAMLTELKRRAAERGEDPETIELKQWRLHDLRRTARTLMARAGVPDRDAEMVLGHAVRGIEGTYNVHRYADEKRKALESLTALVLRIVSGASAEVINLAARRAGTES